MCDKSNEPLYELLLFGCVYCIVIPSTAEKLRSDGTFGPSAFRDDGQAFGLWATSRSAQEFAEANLEKIKLRSLRTKLATFLRESTIVRQGTFGELADQILALIEEKL